MDVSEFRQLFPRFARHISDREATTLLGALEPRGYRAGEHLATFGQPMGTLHFVTGGLLSVHVSRSGEDLLLGQAAAGAIVGEVGVIEPGPASATVEALEATTTFSLERESLERLCEEDPAVASAVLRALSSELARRLRRSGGDIVRRIGDHQWMRSEAKADRKGWLGRLAHLIHGSEGSAA